MKYSYNFYTAKRYSYIYNEMKEYVKAVLGTFNCFEKQSRKPFDNITGFNAVECFSCDLNKRFATK